MHVTLRQDWRVPNSVGTLNEIAKAMETNITGEHELSPFERLPGELRTQIYTYLLDANFLPPDLTDGCRQLHTSVLRVNRRTYHEAKAILYQSNTFIIVSTNWYEFRYPANDDACSYITDKTKHIERFDKATMNLDLVVPWGRPVLDRTSCLLVQQDLSRFLKMVRRFGLIRVSQWREVVEPTRIRINIFGSSGGRIPLKVQRAMLEPVKQLRDPGLQITLNGKLDTKYKAEVLADMMPQIIWLRACAVEIYDHAKSKLDEGLVQFQLRNLTEANNRFSASAELLEGAHINNPRIGRLSDRILLQDYWVLTAVALVNKALTLLHMRSFGPSEMLCARALVVMGRNRNVFPLEIVSKIHCCKSVSEALQDRSLDSHRSIQLALSDNRLQPDSIQAIRCLKKQLESNSMFSEFSQRRLLESQIKASLAPIVPPALSESTPDSLALEVHVLQQLGYKGGLLDHTMDVLVSVNSKSLEKWIQDLKENMRRFPLARVWFGESAAAKTLAPMSELEPHFDIAA
ncbi:hypothetical protein MMC06_005273 [Schaereria dolodes]|nr:hypothetical protein [Schaereria dolodes]